VSCDGCGASVGMLCAACVCVCCTFFYLSINGMIRRSPACSRKKNLESLNYAISDTEIGEYDVSNTKIGRKQVIYTV
jgi:hypothetical protein